MTEHEGGPRWYEAIQRCRVNAKVVGLGWADLGPTSADHERV